MKKLTVAPIILIITIFLCSFNYNNETKNYLKNHSEEQGKAYWYSFYNNGRDKKLYITQVYNNDCNHCSNEINEAFKKWLILNDYENSVTIVNINSLQDIEEASLEERREKTILKYKGYDYVIVKVNFTYNE